MTAAKDIYTHSEQSLGGRQSQYTHSSYDEVAQGSQLEASGHALLAAGQAATAGAVLAQYGIDVGTLGERSGRRRTPVDPRLERHGRRGFNRGRRRGFRRGFHLGQWHWPPSGWWRRATWRSVR